jgi:hypothetical protein
VVRLALGAALVCAACSGSVVDGGGSSDASAGSEGSTASGGKSGAGGAGGSVATGGSGRGRLGRCDRTRRQRRRQRRRRIARDRTSVHELHGLRHRVRLLHDGAGRLLHAGRPGGPMGCRDPEQPCPEGTTCSPLPRHAISGVCMLTCTTSADCRTGYICNYVELFRGDPGSPSSPNKVCWTACEPGVDQTCNDNPLISSLHGTCQDDGTCLCNSGFTPNPDTGRCY